MRTSLQTVGLVRSPREYVPSVECFPKTESLRLLRPYSLCRHVYHPPRYSQSTLRATRSAVRNSLSFFEDSIPM